MKFTIISNHENGRGRAGVIETAHGNIPTPAFIPVATKATIKALTPEQVRDYVGADAVLANTYHLHLQPGTEIIKSAGGLGKFMNWQGPTFTDSGGFQAFSLGSGMGKKGGKIASKLDTNNTNETENIKSNDSETNTKNETKSEEEIGRLAKIDDNGVTFKSVIDGSTHVFTPERSIQIQHNIGADIIFAFDECLSPSESYEKQKDAIERTRLWAKRCITEHNIGLSTSLDSARNKSLGVNQTSVSALFGIVQGGRHEDLRRLSAKNIGAMDFDGFGIGGSFDKDDIGTAVGWVADELPKEKPRHLLGIGDPDDLILGIENGMDTFDCVAPTRIARNGSAYISHGEKKTINLLNSRFMTDPGPIDKNCKCYTCTKYSCSYIAHLLRAKEMLSATLISIHNLYFIVNLVKRARQAIIDNKWSEFKESLNH